MDRTLFFYEKDDYYDFKESKINEGYSFVSITRLIQNLSLTESLDFNTTIIDLSALTEYVNIQSVAEQVIYKLEFNIEFVCDISKKEKLKYELRFLFEEFENIDTNSFNKKERESKEENLDHKLTSKKHKKIIDLNKDELSLFFEDFNNRLYGHSKFKSELEEQINTFRIFNKLGEHKILSLFLMGDSGVGKTEVARAMFNCLEGSKKLAKINFGNYSSEYSLSSLIGASRGYKDSDDGEIFIKVRDTDIGVLLIDEFEKSNATLFNYFLNVLETGIMESSLGQQIDLNGFIIIFTSNISKENFKKKISPELRSRFDYKCMFTLLSDNDKCKYIEFRAESIRKKVNTEFSLEIGDNLKNYLLDKIDVSSFVNMRDINKQVKKEFLMFFKTFSESKKNDNTDDEFEIPSNNGLSKKLKDFLNF